MRSPKWYVLVALVFVVLAFAAPVVLAAPPKGDNRAAPINIVLNSQKTVKKVQNATMEAPAIEDTACDPTDFSDHSVWFRFEMPVAATVDLDASGAIIASDTGTHSSVVISYYEENGGVFTHRGCASGPSARIEDALLSEGDIFYVRIANMGITEPTEPSRYKFSLRVRETLSFTPNGGFLAEPLDPRWKIKKAGTPPKVAFVCDSGCWFEFTGVAKGKAVFKVDIDPSVLRFKPGDLVHAWSSAFMTPAEGAHIKQSITIAYNDGTPPTKVSSTRLFTNTSTNTSQNIGAVVAEVAGTVSSITISVSSPHDDDVFSILTYELEVYSGGGPRDLLPLPPSP